MTWKRVLLDGDAAVLSDTAPINTNHAVAAQGTNAQASRQDHKHDLTEGTTADLLPVDGTAEAIGTADGVSHVDHIHALGPLVATLNVNQKVLDGAVLETSLTAPDAATEVEAQLWYNNNTGSQHPFIWVP